MEFLRRGKTLPSLDHANLTLLYNLSFALRTTLTYLYLHYHYDRKTIFLRLSYKLSTSIALLFLFLPCNPPKKYPTPTYPYVEKMYKYLIQIFLCIILSKYDLSLIYSNDKFFDVLKGGQLKIPNSNLGIGSGWKILGVCDFCEKVIVLMQDFSGKKQNEV